MRQSLLLGMCVLAAALAGRAHAQVITVQKPIGGAIWSVGQPHTIEWTSNLTGANDLRIEVSRNNGTAWDSLNPIAVSRPRIGSFVWTVTGPPTTQARIRVRRGTTVIGVSPAFTIENPAWTFPEKEVTIQNNAGFGRFRISLIVVRVSPDDPNGSGFAFKYMYTLRNVDVSTAAPNSYLGTLALANCRESYRALRPQQSNGTTDNNWTPSTWVSPGTDDIVWTALDTRSHGIGPNGVRAFWVYSNIPPEEANVTFRVLRFASIYQPGQPDSETFRYWTPGCRVVDPDDGEEDGPCSFAFNIAQVYPVAPGEGGTHPNFGPMNCWTGSDTPEPILDDRLAIPGVLCFETAADGRINVNAFISGTPGNPSDPNDTCCAQPAFQNIRLQKVSPPSGKCPIFGPGYTVMQADRNSIRTWWPLAYTMPGTTFTLTLGGLCRSPAGEYREQYRWTVVANPTTFNHLIDLFHTNALGELEVPSIVGEDTYAALKLCAGDLEEAVNTFRANPTQPNRAAVIRMIEECEALIMCNTLFLDHLQAPEEMTYPYHQAAPNRQLPPNKAIADAGVAPCVDANGNVIGGGVIGIIDTDQNPAACKLIVDLEYIGNQYNNNQ